MSASESIREWKNLAEELAEHLRAAKDQLAEKDREVQRLKHEVDKADSNTIQVIADTGHEIDRLRLLLIGNNILAESSSVSLLLPLRRGNVSP